ncbi:pentapeptide repeat-containing protein [Streptomyces sp. NPDC020800]|uniref:pentapeptide repeat-containing protein n=1 Tax=Streptomyces sp. NPDC020800 TaxID=3365092 RepID=UPI00379CC6D6
MWPAGRSGVLAGTDFTGADCAGADFTGADFVVTLPLSALVPDGAAPGAAPKAPARAEQTGQAPQPWACWTFVATAIWALLEAWAAVGA